MTQERMTEMLSETLCATREEAAAALEAREWDLLGAAQLLQQLARMKRAEAARASDDRGARSGSLKRIFRFFTEYCCAGSTNQNNNTIPAVWCKNGGIGYNNIHT